MNVDEASGGRQPPVCSHASGVGARPRTHGGLPAAARPTEVASYPARVSDPDEDDAAALDRLLDGTVEQLRLARGDLPRQREAIRVYLSEGSAADRSPSELWDYFDISTPGLPELAGYDAAEVERAVELFREESDQFFATFFAT